MMRKEEENKAKSIYVQAPKTNCGGGTAKQIICVTSSMQVEQHPATEVGQCHYPLQMGYYELAVS